MLVRMNLIINRIHSRFFIKDDEKGFTTTEILANVALGIAFVVLIWGLLTGVGQGVVRNIGRAVGVGDN